MTMATRMQVCVRLPARILFEGPAGSGFDTTNYLARVDSQGRF